MGGEPMTVSSMLDSAGRRRSPATLPGFHAGRAPRNKGMLYPADPPTVEEIVCVMRHASNDPHGWRLRAMIVMLWRGGLRVQEALALSEHDLDPRLGARALRQGRAPARGRHGRMGLGEPAPVALRAPRAPCGPAVLRDRRPHPWATLVCRRGPHRVSPPRRRGGHQATLRTHQLRHAHAVELAREGESLNVIQRQLDHVNLGTTRIYLQGIDIEEIISTVHARRAPMMSATAGLQL